MSANWNAQQAPPNVSSYNEARLEVIRKLAHRLETMAGVVVVLAVLIAAIAAAVSTNSSDSSAAGIAAVVSGAVALFAGAFFYSLVRLLGNAILFICEHMAGL